MKHLILSFTAVSLLASCEYREDPPEPEPTESATPRAEATNSIFDTEAGVEIAPEPLLPLEVTVGFPEGGTELDEEAMQAISQILESEQLAFGGAIVLRGHSDAGGNDTVNERTSRERAEAVAAQMVAAGIPEDRIEIIAFGEQNPLEPNALPDGTPNEEGRAANRRVEVTVEVPEGAVRRASPSPAASPSGATGS
ncbi:OmpA family protein [Erythrobacter sp. HKB08]|uniref:OmpA family protein n=1 Tax=Erythrobacter sp. HKB08 TaxID=2502843 RepID=UPI0013E8AEFD|nr:OmpA family protein [Erythrobacter sp. HKB08]